jgi:pimeloyl-ACP methyl ester carboxylesterase
MTEKGAGSGTGRGVRTALLATAATAAGAVAAVAVERAAVRRARSRPDPERGERLGERPGRETRVRSFDGTELAVNTVGPKGAATLIFAHGFSIDMTAWHYQWKRFSKEYRCVLYDQRGHGLSAPAANGDYSLDALGHDLQAVLDAEAPRGPVALIGHSMGGMAIMAFAGLHPQEFGDRIRAVVLANTAASDIIQEIVGGLGIRLTSSAFRLAQRLARNPQRVYKLRARAMGRGANLAFLVARATNFSPQVSPTLVDHVVAVAAHAPAEVWTDLFASLVNLDLTDALSNITVPTLVVAGDIDRLTPPATAKAIQGRLPDGRLAILSGAGHATMLEQHEEFNRLLSAFLKEALARREQKAPA